MSEQPSPTLDTFNQPAGDGPSISSLGSLGSFEVSLIPDALSLPGDGTALQSLDVTSDKLPSVVTAGFTDMGKNGTCPYESCVENCES